MKYEGVVKWFKPAVGYGFIVYGDDQSIFVHRSGIDAEIGFQILSKGEPVEFEVGEFEEKPTAIRVQRIAKSVGGTEPAPAVGSKSNER